MSRLNRTTQVILAVALLFCIGALVAWAAHIRQEDQQMKLASQLTVASKGLTSFQMEQLNAQKVEMEKRLQTSAKLKADAVSIFYNSQSITATDVLMGTAATLGLEVTEVKTAGPQKEKVQGVEVVALSLSLKATGEFGALVNFVAGLSQKFPTAVVKSVQIDVANNIGGDITAPGEQTGPGKSSATIQFAVYSYQGEANG